LLTFFSFETYNMPPLGMALRWKTGDEEKGDAITVLDRVSEETPKREKITSSASRRSIDPASAIPIEHRSLYEIPPMPLELFSS
jgi:sodium/potassium-transporting ATPase subunit alpha